MMKMMMMMMMYCFGGMVGRRKALSLISPSQTIDTPRAGYLTDCGHSGDWILSKLVIFAGKKSVNIKKSVREWIHLCRYLNVNLLFYINVKYPP